jgi:signal transduction histidine kinase
MVYLGRVALATGIFLAAAVAWVARGATAPGFATWLLAVTLLFTGYSFYATDIRRRVITPTFSYIQVVFDVVLVTAIVHLTWEVSNSQFAPLYILVIVTAAVLLPQSGTLLIASLVGAIYLAETIWGHPSLLDVGVFLQLLVFVSVALGSGYIVAKLRQAGEEHAEMAAELAAFQLRENDFENLRVRAERLEAVAELSASLAHEIKNPLASIRSAAEQLGRVPAANEDERTLSALVQRESDRLARLLTEFLDFARPSVSQIDEITIATLVKNASDVARTQTGDRIHFKSVLPKRELLVRGDEDMLHRALLNLLLNAVQASPDGAEVRIEAGELVQHQLPESERFKNGAVAVRVIDQGEGISRELRDRLFDPFVTSKPGGSGLGLAVVHRSIEAHGGFVHVDTSKRGSRFTIVLPKSSAVGTAKNS